MEPVAQNATSALFHTIATHTLKNSHLVHYKQQVYGTGNFITWRKS
jgi:hypothetical protein